MGLLPKIVIAIIIIAASVYVFMQYSSVRTAPLQPVAQIAPATQTPQPTTANGIEVSGSNDAALSADLISVDAQVAELDTQSSTATNFNDTPIAQTE